jgi:hypothetical protein
MRDELVVSGPPFPIEPRKSKISQPARGEFENIVK